MRVTAPVTAVVASWSKLAKAWFPHLTVVPAHPSSNEVISPTQRKVLEASAARTLPLLEDPTSVPFVCRYRADTIDPLSTTQVRRLSDLYEKYKSLSSLRNRILDKLPTNASGSTSTSATGTEVETNTKTNRGTAPIEHNNTIHELRDRVLTSVSKTELETLYAPFKPVAKGTLEERYQREHPELVEAINELWSATQNNGRIKTNKLTPKNAAITLLGSRIAHQSYVSDELYEIVTRTCRIEAKLVQDKATDDAKKNKGKKQPNPHHGRSKDSSVFNTYDNFSGSVKYLRDHQVLALRRGAEQKHLGLRFVVDGDRMEGTIRHALRMHGVHVPGGSSKSSLSSLWNDAIHDAWTRLLRRQCTNRLWKEKCSEAEDRAIEVFCQNLSRALLAPPFQDSVPVLALDPGLGAGIKCALLQPDGSLMKHQHAFQTLRFLDVRRQATEQLSNLLSVLQNESQNDERLSSPASSSTASKLVVALGNGHGTNEARTLLREVTNTMNLNVDVHLVNEAGASVWSVTESAKQEFPDQPASAVAAASIGRRFLNPLYELIKIPPKSLGLGMYQHDLSEKELDAKLHAASVDAVAVVGVDGNACSPELLEKVPGITKTLAKRIIDARPLTSRSDLQAIKGLGAKAFENCAGFIRIAGGTEQLDDTLVHPESYQLARWILNKHDLELSTKGDEDTSEQHKQLREEQAKLLTSLSSTSWIEEAATKFDVSTTRVELVAEHLQKSIHRHDPRLDDMTAKQSASPEIGSPRDCLRLPEELHTASELAKSCPQRQILAVVRNVVDFGVFVDVGAENDALVHSSKFGPVDPRSLLIGQQVGVDILQVRKDGKMTASLTGLNCVADESAAQSSSRGGQVRGQTTKRKQSLTSETGRRTMSTSTKRKRKRL